MVVLCGNPQCGAVLRVGTTPTLTEVMVEADVDGRYFVCPRCSMATRLDPRLPPAQLPPLPESP
jgi:hypothetical protein